MSDTKAIIYESELTFISRCVLDYPDSETGGDFFGFWSKNGVPVIQYATGPGKKTTRTSTSFYQDIDYLHQSAEYLYERFALEHIGSWHSHHKLGLDHPSGGDVNTMRNCLDSGVERFFISICNIIKSDKVNINGFLFSKSFSNLYQKANWGVLRGESVIRKVVEGNVTFFVSPRTETARFQVEQTGLNRNKPVMHYEKAELAPDSYFDTAVGKKFLKKEYDKIKDNPEFNNVELVQNEDETIGITFSYNGNDMEIRYPLDFSEKNPNPILIEKNEEKEIKRHNIVVEPAKKYFHGRFDLIAEIKYLFFRIREDKDDKGKKSDGITIEVK